MSNIKRRNFIKTASLASGTILNPYFNIVNILSKPALKHETIGHGDFRYQVEKEWGDLNPTNFPVRNCHEMVMSQDGKILLLTDHPQNNMLIYDKSGRLLSNWTLNFPGAHGLTLHNEGGEDLLYITDPSLSKVVKCTMDGKIIMELEHPASIGAYNDCDRYAPTESAIGPNGDIYIADGYGSQYILQYDLKGKFIRKFGGDSFLQENKFKQAHGVAIDSRDANNPTLLVSARIKNTFKRFTLNGEYLESYYMPGAYISRPVIDGQNLYSGVCFGMDTNNFTVLQNKGFVTILDKSNKVVSNPGGTKPTYIKGKLQIVLQREPIFKHCHDVCIDNDKNLYVCQWNAGGIYPYKLHRV